MLDPFIQKIAGELKIQPPQVLATTKLLADGATVPFISRYRKEATGSLDEVAITAIRDRLQQLVDLEKRRDYILGFMEEKKLLTDEVKAKILAAPTMADLEDVFLPFKPKKRTRAMMAREKGLEPLAARIYEQTGIDPTTITGPFIGADKGVETVEDALAGARDIIAEMMSESPEARGPIREMYFEKGAIRTKVVTGKETEGAKYKDYFDWQEAVSGAPSHRILAVLRGEKEGVLGLTVCPLEEEGLALVESRFVKGTGPDSEQVRLAVRDGYKRLLAPSMENETRALLKERADQEAIRVFTENVRQLLLSPPLGQKIVMALDPGFRSGCKLVILDPQGKLLHHDVIYPHSGDAKLVDAAKKVMELVQKHGVEAVAVGNGTAGRETETFMRALTLPGKPAVIMVNESGASIYSASEVAREEFPEHDVTVRGAVSIGRRLMDPLAELVKIDPKSIGVGQYQHDVDQPALRRSLDDTVTSCVNGVGVEVNTASKQLLTYVSGLGPALAGNIVSYRNENGAFKSRDQLKSVPRLGAKAFEQAAGFLRIRDGENPLDASAVHPESYHIVDRMAKDLGTEVSALLKSQELQSKLKPEAYVTETVGLPTLKDIVEELAKPGRDPRERFDPVQFAEGIEKLEDLKPGLKLQGIVTNVTAFGAFVDIGVHQDGLVHVSQLADKFVKDPNEVVKVHQKVNVTVLAVDMERRRISLTMRTGPEAGGGRPGEARTGAPGEGGERGPRGPRRDGRGPRGPRRDGRPPLSTGPDGQPVPAGAPGEGGGGSREGRPYGDRRPQHGRGGPPGQGPRQDRGPRPDRGGPGRRDDRDGRPGGPGGPKPPPRMDQRGENPFAAQLLEWLNKHGRPEK